jgi:hypothetical protein
VSHLWLAAHDARQKGRPSAHGRRPKAMHYPPRAIPAAGDAVDWAALRYLAILRSGLLGSDDWSLFAISRSPVRADH